MDDDTGLMFNILSVLKVSILSMISLIYYVSIEPINSNGMGFYFVLNEIHENLK